MPEMKIWTHQQQICLALCTLEHWMCLPFFLKNKIDISSLRSHTLAHEWATHSCVVACVTIQTLYLAFASKVRLFFFFVIISAITPAIYSITAYPSLQLPNFHWPQTFLFFQRRKMCCRLYRYYVEPRRKSYIEKQSCLLCFSMETPYFLQILSVLLLFALRLTHSPMLLFSPSYYWAY